MSPRVIICLVTRPADSLFGQSFSILASFSSRALSLSLSFFRPRAFLFVFPSHALFYFSKLVRNMLDINFNTRTILFRRLYIKYLVRVSRFNPDLWKWREIRNSIIIDDVAPCRRSLIFSVKISSRFSR